MKGFIRILESIIASIVILTALSFFFNTQLPESHWDDALITVRSQDLLASMTINGSLRDAINANNPNITNSIFLNASFIDYQLDVNNIPNPRILIGCNCTAGEMADLTNKLNPTSFIYKGRSIAIVLNQVSLENFQSQGINILFMTEYSDTTKVLFANNMLAFLGGGGTVFIMNGTFTQPQIEDGFLNDTFGLIWQSNPGTLGTGNFNNQNNENITSFKIAKYYNGITAVPAAFSFTGSSQIAIDNNTIVNTAAYSYVKTNAVGSGRTIWMFGGSNIQNLTKALVMWGSGEHYELNPHSPITSKSFQTKYIVNDNDVYEVVLTVWKIFT